MNKILKSKGHLILTVPVNDSFFTDFDRREKSKRYSLKELINKLMRANFIIKKTRYWSYPLLNFFYLYFYVPRSNKEASKKIKDYKLVKPILFLLKSLRYIFLLDVLFNNEKSFGLLVVAQKKL